MEVRFQVRETWQGMAKKREKINVLGEPVTFSCMYFAMYFEFGVTELNLTFETTPLLLLCN